MKKILSILLSVIFVLTAFPMTAFESFAWEGEYEQNYHNFSYVSTNGLWMYRFADNSSTDIKIEYYYEYDEVFEDPDNGSWYAPVDNYGTAYSGTATELTIPSTIDGYTVVGIGQFAFNYCTSLTSVTIPSTVTSIGSNAFSGCASLESITIPDSVTSIGSSAFENCTSLECLTIPDGVTVIDSYTCSNCTSLETITIPDSVTSISGYAFYGCTGLINVIYTGSRTQWQNINKGSGNSPLTSANIYYSEPYVWEGVGNTGYLTSSAISSDGLWRYDFTSAGSTEIIIEYYYEYYDQLEFDCMYFNEFGRAYAGKATQLSIPSTIDGYTVVGIGPSAFNNCTLLKSVTIPSTVTRIGNYAFGGCTSLKSITIPDEVTQIEANAFYNTAYYNDSSNWENDVLYIGNVLVKAKSSIGSDYEIKTGTRIIADSAFESCRALESITIPDSVTDIGNNTFHNCTSLTSVTIPDSVTSIGYNVFSYCTSLTSVTIPSGITSIYNNAFNGSAYYNDSSNWENDVLYIGSALIKAKSSIGSDYEIKAGTRIIADSAFESCSALESITIPDSVTYIGKSAFYGNSSLTSVTIPSGVTSIESNAFYGSNALTTVYGYIGSTAETFANSNNLQFVDINLILTADFGYTVTNNEVTVTGFSYDGISELTVPSEIDGKPVTAISDSAFSGFTSLNSIIIPSSVTSIGANAFDGCTSLENVYCFKGSAADTYLQNNSLSSAERYFGDMNDDDEIDFRDYGAIKTYLEGENAGPLSKAEQTVGDYDIDGAIDTFDMYDIDRYQYSHI